MLGGIVTSGAPKGCCAKGGVSGVRPSEAGCARRLHCALKCHTVLASAASAATRAREPKGSFNAAVVRGVPGRSGADLFLGRDGARSMSRRATFIPYSPKRILNKGKRADHWFWSRYSAYPYIGCQHGCEFCYCRERKCSPYEDPQDFAYVIKIKSNAPDLLRRELGRVPVDVVFTGDYQPAEHKFRLSRQMLEVCHDLGFPVFILERSPLVLRDLNLIQAIHARARAVVAFSIISTPDSPSGSRVREIERLAPDAGKRFEAMARLAERGIPTGTCLMPVLPGLSDDEDTLRRVVQWTADHGGQFVLAGTLTLADQQRDYFFEVLGQQFPDVIPQYERLYPAE